MARDLTLLTDLYQLTMMSGYLKNGKEKDIAVFDFTRARKAAGQMKTGYHLFYLLLRKFCHVVTLPISIGRRRPNTCY